MSAPHIPLARPWFDEREARAAYDVVRSEWLFMGPKVAEFEARLADMLGVEHAIAVNSGSSALLVALLALGIGPGHEILVPDLTFVTTGTCALFVGAHPRFVDIELDTYGIDPCALEPKITPRTRAIVPVHYAGQTANMKEILRIAISHHIPVIEDAAEALLSRYQGGAYAGTWGKIGIFSFTPSKLMTVGEGGLLVTDDDEIAARARMARNFGDRAKFSWEMIGFNFRMMDIQGAIGLCQIDKVRQALRRRREIGEQYSRELGKLPGIIPPFVRHPDDMVYQLYTIRIDHRAAGISRDDLMHSLARQGIASRLYYPPLHRAPVFAGCEPGPDDEFPNACTFAQTALSLPIYPAMTVHDVDCVIEAIRRSLPSARHRER